MTISHYRRAYFSGERKFSIRKSRCNCSGKGCGQNGRITGLEIHIFGHTFYVQRGKPNWCNAPF